MTLCLIGLTRLIVPDSCPDLDLDLILPYLGLLMMGLSSDSIRRYKTSDSLRQSDSLSSQTVYEQPESDPSRRRVTRAFKVKVHTLGNMKMFMYNNVGSPSPIKFLSLSSRLFYDAEDKGDPLG